MDGRGSDFFIMIIFAPKKNIIMMKKIFILCILTMLTIVQAKAYDFYALNNAGVKIYYEIQAGIGNRVMVVSREGSSPAYSGVVNIPDQVTYEGVQYVVEAIGSGAFERSWELTEVILPPNIKTIRERAFYQCPKLKGIIIPDKVTSIRYYAFYDCDELRTVSLGAGLTEIGERAFNSCEVLESVTFGNKVSLIGSEAFSICPKLKNVILPESLEEIGYAAFSATGLTSITIPNSVHSIHGYAFSSCGYMEQAVIGDNVSFVEGFAFFSCSKLKKFIVSEQNKNYSSEDGILVSKDKTILVNYPNGKSTFSIPASIKVIGKEAFAGCDLREITIPENVDSIGPEAFSNCSNLKSVIFPENLKIIADRAFQYNYAIDSIVIPDNVVSIGAYAFSSCSRLDYLIIGKNVKEIGICAFEGSYMKLVFNKNPIPQIVEDIGMLDYHTSVFVPVGSGDLYKNANYWRTFNIVEYEYVVANESIINEDITMFNTTDGITVNSSLPTTVAVYSISGQMVYQKYMRDRLDIKLQRGIYIVKAGDVTKKMYVK